MKRLKKIILCLLVANIVALFGVVISASAITTSEVSAKLSALMKQYVGTTWNGYYYGSQCKGFANLIFKEIFGVQHIGPYDESTKYYIASPNGAYEVGRLGFSDMTQNNAMNLLKKGAPGDFIQVRRRNKTYGHSMILVNTNDTGIKVFDCNSDGKNGVKSYDITWATFYSQNSAMSLYHAQNYAGNTSPVGAVDYLTPGINKLSLGGWAYDPDDESKPVDVRIKIGWSVYTIKADKYRAEVASTKYHGFDGTTISVNEVGTQNVSVYAVDLNDGQEKLIGSGTVTIESQKSPVGAVDAIGGGENYIALTGWAYDIDDVSKAATVRIDLTGGSSYTFLADNYRTGVAPTDYHGFSDRITVKETGTYDYKIYVVDLGKYHSPDTLIGSGKITIGIKHFNSYIDTNTEYLAQKIGKLSGLNGELFIQGWAVDTSGIDHVEYEILDVNEQPGNKLAVKGTCTHRDRVDVQQAMPGYAKGKEGFMATIPYSKLKWGFYYPDEVKIVLTAYCKGGQKHRIGEIRVGRTFPEKTAPVISNVQVKDITYKGYTITANVTDASGISRVQFPTWTLKNDQDDILQDWETNSKASGKISGNTVTFQVNVADHNGEAGTYKTHIYAYDKNGNYAIATAAPLAAIEVPAYVKSTGVSLNTISLTLKKGESKTLIATVSPANATSKTITWKTSDANVATVSNTGTVKAIGGGKTVITASTADGKSISCTVQVNVGVTGITLDQKELSIKGKGVTEKLTATIQPTDATDKSVTWTTGNDQVVKVSDTGIITSVGGGQTIITAKTKDGSKTATCNVTVTIPVSSISLDKESIRLTKSQMTDLLTATVLPPDATNAKVIWNSSDDTIATVENGRVTALADGSTVITAVAEDGLKVASCIVNVNLNDSQQFVLAYRGNGGEEIPGNETYTSGQTAIISQVIPVRQGYCFIGWGLSPDAKEAAYQPGDSLVMKDAVTLYALWQENVNGIELSSQNVDLRYIGQTVRLAAFTRPGNKVCEEVEWSSSEPSVAGVETNGTVTAAANGETVITAKTLDGGFSASCKVSVAIPVESISLDCSTLIFDVKDSVTYLTATVLPENAANKKVIWESSNPAVVKVDENGAVTVVGNGTAIIKVSTVDGDKTNICNVIVNYEEECKHEWGEYVVVEEATCSSSGLEATYCILCGEMNENTKRSIPALGHTYEVLHSVPATCEESGMVEKYCTVCGNFETEELAAGHTPGGWEVVKEATVDKEGERVQKCTVCGAVMATEKIPKLEGSQTSTTPTALLSPAIGTQLTDQKSGGVYSVSVAGMSGQAAVEYKAPYNKKIAVANVPDNVVINNVSYKVTSIAANAFKNSKTLRKVTIGRNIVTIGVAAFSGCKKLNSVTLGENVTSIGSKAFYKCAALKKLMVPENVKKIGAKAFYGCGKLKRITFKTTKLTAKKVGSKAFAKIYKKAVVKVPKKVFKSYKKMLRKKGISSGSVIKK